MANKKKLTRKSVTALDGKKYVGFIQEELRGTTLLIHVYQRAVREITPYLNYTGHNPDCHVRLVDQIATLHHFHYMDFLDDVEVNTLPFAAVHEGTWWQQIEVEHEVLDH